MKKYLALVLLFLMPNFFSNLEINNSSLNQQYDDESIYYDYSIVDFSVDFNDSKWLYEDSTYVAIVKIDSIDGSSNYNIKTNESVYPYTYGKMTVLKTLKGDIKENTIVGFYRVGATMNFDEYYNNLNQEEKNHLDTIGAKEKYKIVYHYINDDIEILNNKIYLVYLKDNTFYEQNENSYIIYGFEGGLREIEIPNKKVYSLNDLKVLNNFKNKWESLDKVIPDL